MSSHYPDEWTDLPPELRLELELDMVLFGCAFYEDTADGYERIDPVDAPLGREPDAVDKSADLYGTSRLEVAADLVALRDRINRNLGYNQ